MYGRADAIYAYTTPPSIYRYADAARATLISFETGCLAFSVFNADAIRRTHRLPF